MSVNETCYFLLQVSCSLRMDIDRPSPHPSPLRFRRVTELATRFFDDAGSYNASMTRPGVRRGNIRKLLSLWRIWA
ncbi:hypothetical protein HZ326_24999 [Fusarium oxysporum f. sp. albedinis]|nr:hypothetical protein HZ326_24999 [Fusarium oxysporum f. sp. albedinis]